MDGRCMDYFYLVVGGVVSAFIEEVAPAGTSNPVL